MSLSFGQDSSTTADETNTGTDDVVDCTRLDTCMECFLYGGIFQFYEESFLAKQCGYCQAHDSGGDNWGCIAMGPNKRPLNSSYCNGEDDTFLSDGLACPGTILECLT